MKIRSFHFIILLLALASLLACGILYFSGYKSLTGPFLIAFFAGMAIAIRGSANYRGLSYTLWILAAVTISMFYPAPFLKVGDFELKKLIVPLLQIIMFGMGSQMALSDLGNVIKMPKGVIIGILCQYTIMPFLGITIATLLNFPPEIAAGVILIGSSPSGLASNVMSYIARANLALSVTITAITTLLSPLLTPLLMKLLGGQFVEVSFWKMMLDIFLMVILPIVAGLTFNLFAYGNAERRKILLQMMVYLLIILLKNVISLMTAGTPAGIALKATGQDLILFLVAPVALAMAFKLGAKGRRDLLDKGLAFLSMLGIGIIITIITAAGRDSLMDVGLLLILACFIHNTFGYALGYSLSRFLFRMPEKDCRTVAFEVGMQNGGLASGLALQMGKVATVGLAPAVFGPLMNVTGSALANWWRNKEPKVEFPGPLNPLKGT
jgi:BASS family bile acid:Na+ symporter